MLDAAPHSVPWLAAVQSTLLARTEALFHRFNEGSCHWTRKQNGDLLTDVDLDLHAALADALGAFGLTVLSEEGRCDWPPPADAEVVLLDPLDGTDNFFSGIPCFGTMLTAFRKGQAWASVVWMPFQAWQSRGSFYVAVLDQGAWRSTDAGGWERLRLASVPAQSGYSLAIEGPQAAIARSAWPARLAPLCRMQRMGLSSSWCGTRLACGTKARPTIDAILAIGSEPWDTLPIALLVHEAGGRVSDLQGRPAGIHNCANLLMAHPQVHAELLRHLHEG